MLAALASYILVTVHSSALNLQKTADAKPAYLNRRTYADYWFVHQAYGSAASLRVTRSVRTLVFTI